MNQQTVIYKSTAIELHLLKKPVHRTEMLEGLRDGSTGQFVVVPRLWAVAESKIAPAEEVLPAKKPPVELAFYRKYTEALLRRYLRLSMQSGRVPSLLSRDLFRGHVTRYSVRGFEDVVIFCHDVERRLAKLSDTEQQIIKRVVLQRYTQGEVAGILGMSLTVFKERYGTTLDRLTGMLLEVGLLDPKQL